MIAAGSSQHCRMVLEGKDHGGGGDGQLGRVVSSETDDDRVMPFFEPINVDSDELGKLVREE